MEVHTHKTSCFGGKGAIYVNTSHVEFHTVNFIERMTENIVPKWHLSKSVLTGKNRQKVTNSFKGQSNRKRAAITILLTLGDDKLRIELSILIPRSFEFHFCLDVIFLRKV